MEFSERLNAYLEELSASRRELAAASGLSPATISRYCSGGREPGYGSPQLGQLAAGIEALARSKGSAISRAEAEEALRSGLSDSISIDYDVFIDNLNSLVKHLGIRTSELARGIYSDSSYVSRILSGTRHPGNLVSFIDDVATYTAHRFAGSRELEDIARLTGTDAGSLQSSSQLREHLVTWLGSNPGVQKDDSIPHFLSQMDDFDLGDYMKSVRFDELKLPPSIPHLPTRREYTGIKRMMESELDFMKTTVLSKSNESCILYSDMPLEEMAADPEFPKKYLFGLAMMLKKGLHLTFIHDVNRPFREMMMGLENYIPMYMTGQISPYYLTASQGGVFNHFLKVSGAAALEGIAIAGNQGGGKYVLYRSKEDVAHYRRRAEDLLGRALPLMDIFREERRSEFPLILDKLRPGMDIRFICSKLPLFFLEPETFSTVMDEAGLSRADSENAGHYYSRMRDRMLSILEGNQISLIVPDLTREQFAQSPLGLSYADLFINTDPSVSYESYRRIMEELRDFASQHGRFVLETAVSPAYRNINITVAGDRLVIVSKEKSPTIHFVIYHKKMIRAFQSFVPPAGSPQPE